MTKLFEVLDNEKEEDNEEEEMASLLDPEEGNETSQEMEMVWENFSKLDVWDASPAYTNKQQSINIHL